MLLVMMLLCAAPLSAQTFDAASVKPSAPDNPNGSTFDYRNGGTLRVVNSTLQGLIESAYDVRDFQIAGGPAWVKTDRFDVTARSASGDTAAARADDMKLSRVKLQALLAERFHLIIHRETRERQEYALTAGKGGARLVDVSQTPPKPTAGIQSAAGQLTATQSTMANLVYVLSRRLREPVVDRTGLNGRYDFELTWTEVGTAGDAAADAPSIFTALQEQLGLKLDSVRGPVETLVVDRAERPSAD